MRYLLSGLLALFLVLPAASAFAAPAGPHHDWKRDQRQHTRLYRPAPPAPRRLAPTPRGYHRYAPAPPPAPWRRPFHSTVKAQPYPDKRSYVPWWRR